VNPSDFESALERYFDGQLTAEEKPTFQAHLQADPAARKRFWARARWHNTLDAWGRQRTGIESISPSTIAAPTPASDDNDDDDAVRDPIAPRSVWQRALPIAAAIAAVLTISFALRFGPWSTSPTLPADAVLTFQSRVEWEGSSQPQLDSGMPAGVYRLLTGSIRLNTAAGAAVAISGPAAFEILNAREITLFHGKLAAQMLEDASSLTVHTPRFALTDLGTAFGINIEETGAALVSVFDGKVSIHDQDTAPGDDLPLDSGYSMKSEPEANGPLKATAFNSSTFYDIWPLTVGIDQTSHFIEFLPPGPLKRPLRSYLNDRKIFLLPESQNRTISTPIKVDISGGGSFWPAVPGLRRQSGDNDLIPAGSRVSSHLLFFHPGPHEAGTTIHLTGEVTFAHPIVGIICRDALLEATDTELGLPAAEYSTLVGRRGTEARDNFNLREPLEHDILRISPDRRTLFFSFNVDQERDQIRVLVDAR
jgi:anti-sigma factor RsiW